MNGGKYAPEPGELTGTFLDQWILAGRQKGLQEGWRKGVTNLVLKQAQRRFGRLTKERKEQILALSVSDAEDLGLALFDLQSRADLTAWLRLKSCHSTQQLNN